MGSYTFTWAHHANEVFVTGDFDNWEKTIKLEKEDGVFKKTVELPKSKHHYKFVVDGQWLTNDSHPQENDGKGIYNNVLHPDEISDPISTLSSAAPESSTAGLAGFVPREDKTKSEESIPGAFPLTPPAATPGSEPQGFSINPLPATEGLGNPVKLAPGEKVPDSSTFTNNTVQSTVKHDQEPEEERVSVAPIPATAGAGNPIHLAPGEKVPDPSTFTSNTISSTARTDPASYDKSSSLPPQLGPVDVTPAAEREAKGGMFDLPSLRGSLIPESSLPKDTNAEMEKDPGYTIQSAAPTSTTAALAGAVPKEPRDVPSVVTESQKEAHFPPEASANPEALSEKKELEQELKEKVPEEPPAAESSVAGKAAAAASAVTTGGTYLMYSAKEKAAEAVGLNGQATTTTDVPEIVSESQREAHASPEAAANKEAVVEKKEVEAELLKEVAKTDQTGESAPAMTTASSQVPDVVTESQREAHASPEASANREAVEEKKEVEAELLQEVKKTNEGGQPAPVMTAATSVIPEVVAQSQQEAHTSPEASANTEAVKEKQKMESELLKEVKKTNEAGEPAPTLTAATSVTAPGLSNDALADPKPLKSSSEPDALNASASKPAMPETAKPVIDSRDVSPMSKQPTTTEQTQPTVTTGVESSKTEAKTSMETPKKETAESTKGTPESIASSSAADKKKKRTSIFGKLKAKFNKS